jgi:streptogramin lyase
LRYLACLVFVFPVVRLADARPVALSLAAACAASIVFGACGSGPTGCSDDDLDGYGARCDLGPDCDDTNPLRNTDCDAVPAPDCDTTPLEAGCKCSVPSTPSCYTGAEGTEGVGECRGGERPCNNGHYGLCEGEFIPRSELCDGLDDDCDGAVDEGVRSPCGGCDPACVGGVWGGPSAPFAGDNLDALDVTARGDLVLARERLTPGSAVWMPSTAEDFVVRFQMSPAEGTARYLTGDSPSRVAVDYEGAAWVLAAGSSTEDGEGAPQVTKIAGDLTACVDGNDDGVSTSTDPQLALEEGADECVLVDAVVGVPGEVASAIAVEGPGEGGGDAGGAVWVAFENAKRIVRLRGTDGAELDAVDTPGFAPHAAAFDPWGYLWLVSKNGYLARVDRRQSPPALEVLEVPFACFLLHDVATDDLGRVWMTGASCNTAVMYDPDREAFEVVTVPEAPRGITVHRDAVWISHAGGFATRLTAGSVATAPMLAVGETIDLADGDAIPYDVSGLVLDGEARIWALAGGVGASPEEGRVLRTDSSTGEALPSFSFGVGAEVLGDLSGDGRRGGFVGPGSAAHVFDGCGPGVGTAWKRLHVRADTGATGSIEVAVRHATSQAALGGEDFVVLGTLPADGMPFALGAGGPELAPGGVLEVRMTLASGARDGSPRVREVGVEWECPAAN